MWSSCLNCPVDQETNFGDFTDLAFQFITNGTTQDLETFFVTAQPIWYSRNQMVHESTSSLPIQIWETARRTFKDYKGALSTAFQLKSNPALCWTAPPPGTHKYGRKIISFYLLFLIYLSLLHFFGNNHGLVENLLLSHLFSKFIS